MVLGSSRFLVVGSFSWRSGYIWIFHYQDSFVHFRTHQCLCYFGWTYETASCVYKIRKFPNCCWLGYIFQCMMHLGSLFVLSYIGCIFLHQTICLPIGLPFQIIERAIFTLISPYLQLAFRNYVRGKLIWDRFFILRFWRNVLTSNEGVRRLYISEIGVSLI